MLSICIPIHNVDVRKLVKSLDEQINKNHIDAEIILLDDGSAEHYKAINGSLADLSPVRYFKQENQGRSTTRNKLALKARGDNLIFIDCDCMVKDDFLTNYLTHIDSPVVIGGLSYNERPDNKDLLLRWKYGIKRECKINYSPANSSFLSSNFMIDRSIFNSIGFDQNIKAYGHEDTLLGIKIRERGINIIQINNPVIHMGLDTAKTFLKKTEQAMENLFVISKTPGISNILDKNTLVKIIKSKTPTWLNMSLSLIYKMFCPLIKYTLTNLYPSLFLFDTYKFFYIFHLKSNYKLIKGSN